MSVITNGGRADFARAKRDEYLANPKSILIACGKGEDWWGENQAEIKAFSGDPETISSDYAPVAEVVLKSADGTQTFVEGSDFEVTPRTGSITRLAAGSIPPQAQVRLIYRAGIPTPEKTDTALVSEIGWITITGLDFVLPLSEVTDTDPTFLEVDGAQYAFVSEPSRMLLARARLRQGDGVGDPIREYGIFVRCAVNPDLPEGQQFYTPEEISDRGVLAIRRTRSAIPHDGTIALDINLIIEI